MRKIRGLQSAGVWGICLCGLFLCTQAYAQIKITVDRKQLATSRKAYPELINYDKQTPPTAEVRLKAARQALKALSYRLRGSGLKHPGANGGITVTYAMAGLAFLADGGDIEKKIYHVELKRIAHFLDKRTGKVSASAPKNTHDLSNWAYSASVMFFAELQARNPSEKHLASLEKFVDVLLERQSENGGWMHGAKQNHGSKYTEFNAINIWVLSALSMAKAAGVAIDQRVFDDGMGYMKKTMYKSGGLAYNNGHLIRHVQPGRSAGAAMLWHAMDEHEDKHCKLLMKYGLSGMYRYPRGHGSAVMHIFWGAGASWLAGDKAWGKFWLTYGPGMIKRQEKIGDIKLPRAHPFEGKDRATAMQAWIMLMPEQKLKLFLTRPKVKATHKE